MNNLPYDRLLGELPFVFDTDAHPEPCILIATIGVTLEVRDAALRVQVATVEHVIPLTGTAGTVVTLNDVMGALQSIQVDAFLERPDLGNVSARVLLDVPAFVTSATTPSRNYLYVFNNTLWVILRPLGMALETRAERNLDALRSLNLLTATGIWADTWGKYLGIARRLGETDTAYTARMKHWIIRERANNKALEVILLEDLGLHARVENLLPLVLIWNETPWASFHAGNIYNSGAFRVHFANTAGVASADVIALIEKHRPAGTRFILLVEQDERGQLTLQGHVLQGASFVWDGRASGLILRARAEGLTGYRQLVSNPNPLCRGSFIAWGEFGSTTLLVTPGDWRGTIPVGVPAWIRMITGEPIPTQITAVVQDGKSTRLTITTPIPIGRRNIFVATAVAPSTEIELRRQPRWLPGSTAMPGSIMAS